MGAVCYCIQTYKEFRVGYNDPEVKVHWGNNSTLQCEGAKFDAPHFKESNSQGLQLLLFPTLHLDTTTRGWVTYIFTLISRRGY